MRSSIKISVLAFALIVIVLASFQDLSAQTATKSSTDAELMYTLQKKDPAISGVVGLAVPFLGCGHAGEIKRCMAPGAVAVGGWALMIASGSQLGFLVYMGGSVWGAFESYNTASDRNAALRQKLGLPPLSMELKAEPGFEPGRYNLALVSIKF